MMFSFELWQCSQAITSELLSVASYRLNTRGIHKRNKVPLAGTSAFSLWLSFTFGHILNEYALDAPVTKRRGDRT